MVVPLYCCSEYKVDSDGFIISKTTNKPMKPSTNPHGYLCTTVMIDGKRKAMPIHSAVAKSFLGDQTVNGMVVNHKDGNKQNNRLDNLEWVTPAYNSWHSVNILGNNVGDKNGSARAIYGVDAKSHKVKYQFTTLIGAAKFFANGAKNERRIQTVLWKALNHYEKSKSYRGCLWFYEDEYPYDIENDVNVFDFDYKPDRGFRKLSNEDVKWIRENYIPYNKEFGTRGIAKKFNVDRSIISDIVNYKTYKEVC